MLPRNSVFCLCSALSATMPLFALSGAAQADITISSAATQNIICSGGVCTPTATSAVLNSGDLETLLASGNVAVTTTGSGVQANNIVVGDGVSWSAATGLTLDAYQSVSIDKGIAVQGQAGLTLTTNDGGTGGTLAFGHKGNVSFANLSSSLTVNGTAYTLVNTIQSLAAAIAANPAGAYALASNYDASQDGTYTTVPVPTPFTGTCEGLGNAVSNLSINDTTDKEVGLFAEVDDSGALRDIAVLKAEISVNTTDSCAAPLVGFNYGNVVGASASGSVVSASCVGGLVGYNFSGIVTLSNASTSVSGVEAGGLTGRSYTGNIVQSFATGKAAGTEYAGGLVGDDSGSAISNCYATSTAQATSASTYVGGFASQTNEESALSNSYSAGHVLGGISGRRGGFVGATSEGATFSDTYWNTKKSGVVNRHEGAGNVKNQAGITGLSTKQMQKGLPDGFDPSIWSENSKINGGLPYLLANPPR